MREDTLAENGELISFYKKSYDPIEEYDYAITEQVDEVEKNETLGCERRTAKMQMDSKSTD